MSKADRIYDIAETLGYTGKQDGSTADAINAISDTLGYSGTHQQRISGALADLNTVVGGGGGGNLGASVSFWCNYDSDLVGGSLDYLLGAEDTSLMVRFSGDSERDMPSGLTYLLGGFAIAGTTVAIVSADDVSAEVYPDGAEEPEPFTDFTVVELMGAKVIRVATPALSEGCEITFTISPQSGGGGGGGDVSI